MKFLTTALLALLAVAFVGCNKTDSAASGSSTTAAASDVPTFSSSAVNDYVKEYAKFCDEYIAAYKSKDTSKIQALATKQSEWAQKAQTAMQNLKADEVQKLNDWMTKKAQQMSDALTK